MPLADLQRDLAAGLAAGSESGLDGCDPRALDRARRALESKRRQAAGHLLPRLRAALGGAWNERFHEHARCYTPAGLLHHVDDAWELAAFWTRDPDPRLAVPAREDLLALRLRYTRRPGAGAGRIRERRAPLVAIVRRRLIVRLPGIGARTWLFRLP